MVRLKFVKTNLFIIKYIDRKIVLQRIPKDTGFKYYKLVYQIYIPAKMYSVHVTPGRSTERKKNSTDMDNEIRTYGRRRKESISVKLINYIRSQFQSDAMSGESEKV